MNQDIEIVELDLQEAKDMVQLGKDLEKLLSNRAFKRLFQEGYCEKEAIRLVGLLSSPETNRTDAVGTAEEKRAEIVSQMEAIGHFRTYLKVIQHKAMLAEKAIIDNEEALIAMRLEDEEA